MAGLTREQRAAREALKAAGAVESRPDDADHGIQASGLTVDGDALEQSDGLTAMSKDGETLRVHPTCVKAHQSAGWTLEHHN